MIPSSAVPLPAPVAKLLSLSRDLSGDGLFGQTLMALSASKANGLSLVLNPGDGFNLSWIIAGLPNDSKLLATCEAEADLAVLRQALDTDLRVAFHCQEISNFIHDIAHHRFNLIYCDHALNEECSNQLQNMLMPGGFLVADPVKNKSLINVPSDVASLLPFPFPSLAPLETQSLRLYVKGDRPLKRRGGRKAKHDRPSLRSA